MSLVVSCADVEVVYMKISGGSKSLKDSAIEISELDEHLNKILSKTNFRSFISIKLTNIRMVVESNSDTEEESDDSDDEIPELNMSRLSM